MKKGDLYKVIQKLTLLAEGKPLHMKSTYTPTISAASIADVKLCVESVAEGDIDVSVLDCAEKEYRPYTYKDACLFRNMFIYRVADNTLWQIYAWRYSGVILRKQYCDTHTTGGNEGLDVISVDFDTLLNEYTKKNGELLGVALISRKKKEKI